jgi:WD40 repeat protein
MPRHHLWQSLVSPTCVLGLAVGVGVYLQSRENAPDDPAGPVPGVLRIGNAGPVYVLAYAPDGKTLASGAFHDRVRVWAPATGVTQAEFMNSLYRTSALAYAPDSQTLAIAGIEPAANNWDVTIRGVASGDVDAVLHGHTDKVVELAYTPDGKVLASASLDGTVRLWDTAGHRLLNVIRGSGSFHCLALEAGGKTLLTGGIDGTVRRWDAITGRELGVLLERRGIIHHLAMSPDGTTLATWEIGELVVRLWDAATGHPRATARGHTGYVQQLAFAPDGRTLASAALDGTVRLWDAVTGRPRAVLHSPDGLASHALAFAPDGSILATGGGSPTLTLWDVPRSLAGLASVKDFGAQHH